MFPLLLLLSHCHENVPGAACLKVRGGGPQEINPVIPVKAFLHQLRDAQRC